MVHNNLRIDVEKMSILGGGGVHKSVGLSPQ
jgi:hypothetical protein